MIKFTTCFTTNLQLFYNHFFLQPSWFFTIKFYFYKHLQSFTINIQAFKTWFLQSNFWTKKQWTTYFFKLPQCENLICYFFLFILIISTISTKKILGKFLYFDFIYFFLCCKMLLQSIYNVYNQFTTFTSNFTTNFYKCKCL